MSADSPRRSGGRSNRQGGGSAVCGNGGGQIVAPQNVTDPSIIDSVTGFINDVVPQAYTSTLPGDSKETITWARFESADINDPAFFPDSTSDTVLPLILILGYNTGVQVWTVPANGEATEVLSWSQGCVRTLRILPSPVSNLARNSDLYATKRPLVALCDSAGPGPPFCSVSFISLKTGDQVKSIKFKNPVCDVFANRRSVIVTFPEKIAVFDACSLEDRLCVVTTCYLSPGPNVNPVALGSRWLAYAEKKLVAWQRSSGGVGGGGAQSYTATVLHAAQTLGRGLRELSETVASSLTGPRNHSGGSMGILGSSPPTVNGADHSSPGIVTVLDLEAASNRFNGTEEGHSGNSFITDSVIAHFIAHNEAIVALEFDPSGTLLLTADRRGHDFHVFRLQPHPSGSSLAAVHHLYVLHRGDTTAKVQNIAFSCDSRWVAVSTLRGTTHVFPLTPYGGPVGFRTHGSPLVVNRLSRFHRSAGLSADGRSSPVPSPESPPCLPAGPHANPRLPPYPNPTVQSPLSQLRQSPHPPLAPAGTLDVSLKVCATFASPRAWLLDSQTTHPREGPRDSSKVLRRPVDSLFVMAHHGNLVQYDLDPKPTTVGPREKICDDTQIELEVEAKAQWPLQRSSHFPEVLPPLSPSNLLLCGPELRMPSCDPETNGQLEERWLSQVEIVTHAGPHRRLWMGPQITFKTYTSNTTGSNVLLQDVEAVEVGTVPVSRPARSNPVNMPAGGRPVVPVLIESGSGSSFEQSPHLLEVYGADSGDAEHWGGQGDSRLREDLADAMLESPGAPSREKGKRRYCGLVGGGGGGNGGGNGGGGGGDEVGEGRGWGSGPGPVQRVVNPGGAEITVRSWTEFRPDGLEDEAAVGVAVGLATPGLFPVAPADSRWEAVAIPASAPLIPVPLDPGPDSDSQRQMVTTIAAAQLQRVPVQLPHRAPPPPQPQPPAEASAAPADAVQKRSAELHGGVASESVGKGVEGGSAAGDREAGTKKSGRGSAGKGVVSGKKGSSPEKEMQSRKEGSVDRDLSVVQSEVRKGAECVEPPLSRKKIKKGALAREVELSSAVEVNSGQVSLSQNENEEVMNVNTSKKSKDVQKSGEAAQVAPGKKGKQAGSVTETSGHEAISRKSPSPQKEFVESNLSERASSTEKEPDEDVPPTSSKKGKKKSSTLLKETFKKGDSSLELYEGKRNSASKVELLKSDCSDLLVVKDRESQEIPSLIEQGEPLEIYQSICDLNSAINVAVHDLKCEIVDEGHALSQSRRGSDQSVSLKEVLKPSLQTQVSSKVGKKSLKSRQNSGEELPLKSENELEGSIAGKTDCDVAPKGIKNTKVDKEDTSENKDGVSSGKVKKGSKLRESENFVESVKPRQKEAEDATLADASRAMDDKSNNQNIEKGSGKDALENILITEETAPPVNNSVKGTKRGSKLSKTSTSEAETVCEKPEGETCETAVPANSSASNVWGIQSNTEVINESFPALPTKNSNKVWGNAYDDASKFDEKKLTTVPNKAKSEASEKCPPSPIADIENIKPKRGWELPNSVNSHDMDIEKLTFEDLEAIVDAACKEEETKAEETCLKENKKGKKADHIVTNSPKMKGKENVEEDVNVGRVDSVEIIEVPKPVEDLVKPEEPTKAPEKPLSTPNRSSKAHRKKRR